MYSCIDHSYFFSSHKNIFKFVNMLFPIIAVTWWYVHGDSVKELIRKMVSEFEA